MNFDIQSLFEAYGKPWREFRTAVGARHTVLNRYKTEGMPAAVADRFATRCDLHPVEVWGIERWLAEGRVSTG